MWLCCYNFHLWESFLYTLAFFGGRHGALASKHRTLAFGVLPLPLAYSDQFIHYGTSYNIHNDWLTYFILANYGLDDGLFSQAVAEVSKFDFTKTKTSDLASIFELTVQIAITTHKQGNHICHVLCMMALTNTSVVAVVAVVALSEVVVVEVEVVYMLSHVTCCLAHMTNFFQVHHLDVSSPTTTTTRSSRTNRAQDIIDASRALGTFFLYYLLFKVLGGF